MDNTHKEERSCCARSSASTKKSAYGCGACARACHEGAIAMVNGKARLVREDYCDGLGDCLPACPTNAISFEVREAAAYDEADVRGRQSRRAPRLPRFPPRRLRARGASRKRGQCAQPALPVAGADQARARQRPVVFLARICSSPPTAPPLPTATSMPTSSAAASRWWAAPSSTPWTTRKSSRRSFPPTTSAPSPWRAWKCPAAAVWKAPCAARLEMSGKDIPLAVSTIAINGELLESGR